MIKITRRLEVEYKGEIRELRVGDDIALLRISEDKKESEYVSGEIIRIGFCCFTLTDGKNNVYCIALHEVVKIIEVEQNIWGIKIG